MRLSRILTRSSPRRRDSIESSKEPDRYGFHYQRLVELRSAAAMTVPVPELLAASKEAVAEFDRV
jgi:hypothetical protein